MFAYIHVPFCRQKCPYCKFALTPFVQEAKIANYLGFLNGEIDRFMAHDIPSGETIDSIYFGGGTPSVLSAKQISAVLSRFPKERRNPDVEITLEANPEDITEDFVRGIIELWVNRLSLGVQSLNDRTLAEVHRSSKQTIFDALDAVSHAWFANVNVDFILGLPYAGAGETLGDIRTLHERYANILHTSVYFLEKGDYPKHWKGLGIDDEAMTHEYAQIAEYLVNSRGFHHYEISNFGKPGYESSHNRAYWSHGNVRGFGLSAASFMNGVRFENAPSFAGYYRGEIVAREEVTGDSLKLESAMFWLRTFSLDPSLLADPEKALVFEKNGLIVRENWRIRPTLAWIFVLDHIMSELL